MANKKKTKEKSTIKDIKDINKAKKIVDIDKAKEEIAEVIVEAVVEEAKEEIAEVIVEAVVEEAKEEIAEVIVEAVPTRESIIESNLNERIKMLQKRYNVSEVPETRMGQYQLKIWYKKKARQMKLESESDS